MQTHVRRREPGPGSPDDHLESRHHSWSWIGKEEHDTVAEPLHRSTAVMDRRALHEPGQLACHLCSCGISALLGEARVAGDVEEAHRGWVLEAAVQPGAGQLALNTADDVRRPGVCLLGMEGGEQRPLAERGHFIIVRIIGGLAGAHSLRHQRLEHLGVPPIRLGLGDAVQPRVEGVLPTSMKGLITSSSSRTRSCGAG